MDGLQLFSVSFHVICKYITDNVSRLPSLVAIVYVQRLCTIYADGRNTLRNMMRRFKMYLINFFFLLLLICCIRNRLSVATVRNSTIVE